MSPAVAAAMGRQLDVVFDVAVVEVPGLIVADRLAAPGAANIVAAPNPLLPLAAAASMLWPIPFAMAAVTHQPRAPR